MKMRMTVDSQENSVGAAFEEHRRPSYASMTMWLSRHLHCLICILLAPFRHACPKVGNERFQEFSRKCLKVPGCA